jgi:hypothetical protein
MTTSKINFGNPNKFEIGDIAKHTMHEYYILVTNGDHKIDSGGCWNTVIDGVVILPSCNSPIGKPILGEFVEKFEKVSKGTSVTLTQQ